MTPPAASKNELGENHTHLNHTEAQEFNKRGLFIGGCVKSGTTLLMSLLDSHPQLIVLPEETSYLERRYRRYLKLKNCQARLEYLLHKTALAGLGVGVYDPHEVCPGADVRNYSGFDYQRFVALARDFINQPGMNDSLLFSETVRAYGIVAGADWRKCVRWVEKTPRSETHGDVLDELFPDAKLIQMVRDPRAVFASLKNRDLKDHGYFIRAHELVRAWNRSARETPRLQRDPSRFLVIRYEDLVSHPREILEQICRFGGFDFSEGMLEPTRAGAGWQGNSAFYKAFKGISAAPADRWKDCLTELEILWVELHCRKGMELMNYPLQTNGRFSWPHWSKKLPGESAWGYARSRVASLRQLTGTA